MEETKELTITEVYKLKNEAEENITNLLREFKDKTGICIQEVAVHSIDSSSKIGYSKIQFAKIKIDFD